MVAYKQQLFDWNRVAAMITDKNKNNYVYPIKAMIQSNKHSILQNHLLHARAGSFSPSKRNQNDRILWQRLSHCVQYAAYAYFYEILNKPKNLEIKNEWIYFPTIMVNQQSFNAGYFIGIDHENKKILLCIRGTETLGDALTDMDATPNKLLKIDDRNYYVHTGIWEATVKLHTQVTNTIVDLFKQHGKKYDIEVTGHSLGAGICSLLGLLWHFNCQLNKNSDVNTTEAGTQLTQTATIRNNFHCYSFASPCVIDEKGRKLSLELVDKNGNYIITSVANTIDIVTRLSVPAIVELSDRVDIIKNMGIDAWECIDRICDKRLKCKTDKEFDNWINSNSAKKEKEFVEKLRNPSKHNPNSVAKIISSKYDGMQKLYPCGMVIYNVPGYISRDQTISETYLKLDESIHFANACPAMFQLFVKTFCDIFGHFWIMNRQSALYKIDGKNGIPIDIFQSMVYNTGEALQAHMPGRYTEIFRKDIIDVFKLSSQSWVSFLPTKDERADVGFARLCAAAVVLIVGRVARKCCRLFKLAWC